MMIVLALEKVFNTLCHSHLSRLKSRLAFYGKNTRVRMYSVFVINLYQLCPIPDFTVADTTVVRKQICRQKLNKLFYIC